MPGIVGVLKVNTVSSSAVLHVGDVFNIAPNSQIKTYAGAGSFNTGDFMDVNNSRNTTRVNDPDLIDNSELANN